MNKATGFNYNEIADSVSDNNKKGFTLIELSIVLVIIGLIVGGVLVGQDLIKAATIRATVAQIEKYNTAINTFQTKFNGLPGDLDITKASAFGLYTAAGTAGRGDNNGLIDGVVGGTVTQYAYTQEGSFFWVHLSSANLLDGTFTGAWDGAAPTAFTSASTSTILPLSKIARGNYINVGSYSGLNYYMIAGITAGTALGAMTSTVGLTPTEVYNMDVKLDDGAPLTGIVQTHATTGSSTTAFSDPPSSAAAAASGTCLVGDTVGTATTDIYNLKLTAGGATPACEARFRFN